MRYKLIPPKEKIDLDYYIPGSKSYTNRALIMAALAKGNSVLSNCSHSDDSKAMIRALKSLGINIEESSDEISVAGQTFNNFNGVIDVGPAGTTARFLTALCALLPGVQVELRGTDRLHERPVGPLVDALRVLGADIEYLGKENCPPLLIKGKALSGKRVPLEGSVSSQFFTALLLCRPLLTSELEIEVVGEQISKSYIDMTLSGMSKFGLPVVNNNYRSYTAGSATYKASKYIVEGDASGASYPWSMAAIGNGRVRVYGIGFDSAQGDAQFPKLLEKMGCSIRNGSDSSGSWIEVEGCDSLSSIDVDMSDMPDTAQTLAVVASVAEGKSTITGLETLAHKETDRIVAVKTELAKLGISTDSTSNSLTVTGGTLGSASISTYEDHRMAMSFACLASKYSGIEICDPDVVNKSFPSFWELSKSIGIRVDVCS